MEFDTLLRLMVEKKASDLFITRGVPPSLKINGQIMPVGKVPLSASQTAALVEGVMDVRQRHEFHTNHELNFAIGSEHVGVARFRVSAFTSATTWAWCCVASKPASPPPTNCCCRAFSTTW